MCDYREFGQAQLRKVLNLMFPPSYVTLYHMPPNSVCSLLDISPPARTRFSRYDFDEQNGRCLYEVSTEPSCREAVIALRDRLDSSLNEHRAKPFGLCPIRRAIYNQCFDELIRQVTVGCVEQGLLLYRIRNELRLTLNCYKKAYESGVFFGLNKAVEVEVQLETAQHELERSRTDMNQLESQLAHEQQIEYLETTNKLEAFGRLQNQFADEMKKKDQVIEQQRSMIRALSSKLTDDMKSPLG